MRLPSKQRGLGWFGLLFIFFVIGFTTLVTMKTWPLYLNEIKLARAVKAVANDPELASSEVGSEQVRNALQKWWNIDDIEFITPKDVKLKTSDKGRVLAYDYWAQVNLFSNVYISFHFTKEEPFRKAG